MNLRSISNPQLTHFLKREARSSLPADDLDLSQVFCDILKRANDFLPSEAGSVFLDDPVIEDTATAAGDLVIIACFGALADRLVGARIRANAGIVGGVYRTGRTYCTTSPEEDPLFFLGPGRALDFPTRSVICAPLRLDGRTIGVIELINHIGADGYADSDLDLLEIFAQTISASIVSAIDAQRSREMAKRDDLTGLYNDRYLHRSLSATIAAAINSGGDCGIVFLDLDHFKTINDTHGHLVGSRVLAEVGATLRQILPGQSIASRYGGDEFVIVLPGAGRQEAYWVAETVRKNLECRVFLEEPDDVDPVNYPGLRIAGVITCSIGIATLVADVLGTAAALASDVTAAKNELMRKADQCMYRAKETGRNRTVAAWQPEYEAVVCDPPTSS